MTVLHVSSIQCLLTIWQYWLVVKSIFYIFSLANDCLVNTQFSRLVGFVASKNRLRELRVFRRGKWEERKGLGYREKMKYDMKGVLLGYLSHPYPPPLCPSIDFFTY